MRFTALLPVAFASFAAAAPAPDFAIGSGYLYTASNQAQLDTVTKAVAQALSSHQASLTAQPEWTSAYSELVEFQETHRGVPDIVTDLEAVTVYATTPSWYAAMPTDLQNYLNENQKKQDELIASVVKGATGDAARPISMGVYIHGAIVALIAGVAIAL